MIFVKIGKINQVLKEMALAENATINDALATATLVLESNEEIVLYENGNEHIDHEISATLNGGEIIVIRPKSVPLIGDFEIGVQNIINEIFDLDLQINESDLDLADIRKLIDGINSINS